MKTKWSAGFLVVVGLWSAFPLTGQIVSTINLTPVADAYVQGGNNAGRNFGLDPSLFVQSNTTAKNNYDTYFQFNLAGLGNLSTAKLRLKARLAASGTLTTTVYATTTWGESTITWNNKPNRGAALGSVTVSGTVYAWYEVDVSSFAVQEKAAGRTVICLCLHNVALSSQNIDAYSREAASANRPILVCGIANVLPTVSITQPAANAVFTAPATVNLTAIAADSDGSIAQVSFYQGTTLLGTDTTAPYSLTWSSVGAGAYALTAKARDNNGGETTSASMNITVNNPPPPPPPPTVSITSPLNGAVFVYPANVTVAANATITEGTVTQVQFYDGQTLLNTDPTAPYSFLWSGVAAGNHTLTAQAYSSLGPVTTSSAVTITIDHPPAVSLTAPVTGAVIISPAQVTLNANATDPDGTITKVEFYDGSTLLNTDTSAPYSYLWNVAVVGNHSLTARAYDNLGAVTISSVVNITLDLPPLVSLTSPADGAVLIAPTDVTLVADASDPDGIVARVEFYDGPTLLHTDTTAPYSYVWNNVPLGNHSLTARASDDLGVVTISSAANVTIDQPPAVSLTAPVTGAVIISPAQVTLNANATAPDGTITKVEFYDGSILLNTDTSAPYSYLWNVAVVGNHPLTARAYDNLGVSTISSVINITLDLAPFISLTSPADGAVLVAPTDLTLVADASDADGAVARVEFYDGPTLLSTDASAPYSYVWNNVPPGIHSLTALAYDDLGVATISSAANVTIDLAPVVRLTSPSDGAVFYLYSDVTITAVATDADGTVSQVRFLVDGSPIGTDTGSPYSMVWSPSPGTHVLTAEATDNNGATRVSAPVRIEILPLDADPGLTGYWKFEEGSGAVAGDSSGHGNVAAVSSPAWAAGKVGAHALDVSSATALSIPNPNQQVLPATGRPFGLSLWIKPTDLNFAQTVQTFLIGNASGQSGWRLGVIGSPGQLQFRCWSTEDGGTLNVVTPAPLTLNVWSQLALSFNADRATLYLDGIKLGSGSGAILGNANSVALGNGDAIYAGFPAELDDLKIYNRELAPIEFGLTGHWTFEEGAGLQARDTSGHDNDATLQAPLWTTGRAGNRAVEFAGGYGWFGNLNNHALPETGRPFSISCWFSPDSLPSGLHLLMAAHQTGVSGWQLGINTPGLGTSDIWFWTTDSGGSLFASGNALLLPGQWYKLTVTYSGTEAKLYLDSRLLAQASGALVGNALPIFFGGGVAGTTGLPTKLDDLRTYSRELSWEEISLNGHWRLDESTGQLAGDSSGQGHPAQISSGNWTAGKEGFGSLNAAANPVLVSSENYAVLPSTGGSFSLSLWLYPYTLPVGYSGLLASDTFPPQGASGWQLAYYRDGGGTASIRFWSIDRGGTLDLWASAETLAVSSWNKLDVTFNGGIATVYINGRKIQSDNGGILTSGGAGAFKIGGLAGIPDFNGAVDEVKVYNRSREESEIGPLAAVAWETAWMNTTTNLPLPGSAPAGTTATYTLVASPTNGTATVSGAGIATYTPNPGYKGPDAFTYRVSDGEFVTPPTVVALSVVKVRYLSLTGGSLPPLDGSSPEKAWVASPFAALDDIYRTNKYYDCFYYLPGTYETMGWKYEERKTANPGCKHMGSGREGPNATILKLVNLWHSSAEETIFASLWYLPAPDGFEVHDMVLDCNAANNPKYAVGEPITVTVPLASAQLVDRIKLFWNASQLPNSPANFTTGSAQEYEVFARDPVTGQNNLVYSTSSGAGGTEQILLTPAVNTAQIQIRLTRRGAGVSFYSLRELEVFVGANNVALGRPVTAINLYGSASAMQWDIAYSASRMVDGDYATAWASGTQGMCGAINVGANNLKFINLKVIGFGTKAWRECFPIYITVGAGYVVGQEIGNILLDNCVVSDPATSNADGCTAITMLKFPPFTLTNAVIRNTQVLNLRPFFNYTQAFMATRVENSQVSGLHTGFYLEPDEYSRDSGAMLIQSNRFNDVQTGILLAFHPDIQVSSLTAIGNEFVLSSDGSWGIAAYDWGASSLTNVTVLNNVVRFNGWVSQAGSGGGLHASNMRNALFGNNVIVLGNSSDLRVRNGWDILPPGYRRAWFNNRSLSGALLPVRYHDGSFDTLATQQQWP